MGMGDGDVDSIKMTTYRGDTFRSKDVDENFDVDNEVDHQGSAALRPERKTYPPVKDMSPVNRT